MKTERIIKGKANLKKLTFSECVICIFDKKFQKLFPDYVVEKLDDIEH